MPNLSGPFAAARRALEIVKEKAVADSIRSAAPGTIADRLNALFMLGAIDRPQYHELFFTDPRRSGFEIAIIEELEKQGTLCAGNLELFEQIQQEGSRYFFDNHSPLVRGL